MHILIHFMHVLIMMTGIMNSKRGVGVNFGPEVTKEFLKGINYPLLLLITIIVVVVISFLILLLLLLLMIMIMIMIMMTMTILVILSE